MWSLNPIWFTNTLFLGHVADNSGLLHIFCRLHRRCWFESGVAMLAARHGHIVRNCLRTWPAVHIEVNWNAVEGGPGSATPDMWHHCQHLYLQSCLVPEWLQWTGSRNALWKEAVCDNKIRNGIKELLNIALVWCMGPQIPTSASSQSSYFNNNLVRIKWKTKTGDSLLSLRTEKGWHWLKVSGQLHKISKKRKPFFFQRAKIWPWASNVFSLCASPKPFGQISFRSDESSSTSMQTDKP